MKTLLFLALGFGSNAQAFDDIINGSDTPESSYPSAGGILLSGVVPWGGTTYELKLLMCTGTLIAPDVVLLAAHCLDLDSVQAQAGIEFSSMDLVFSRQADLSSFTSGFATEWPDDAVFAWEGVGHEGFSMYSLQMGLAENDDIGLLFLEEPILDVDPAIVVTPSEADAIVEGAVVDIVGWGQQTSDQTPPAGTVGTKMGGESVIGRVADFEFQVGPDGSDVRKCHGDSGGPTYMDIGGSNRVIGVTSHAYDWTDCRETGGVDTRIDYYLDWIDDEMRSRCESEERVWCDVEGILSPDDVGNGTGNGGTNWDDDTSDEAEEDEFYSSWGLSSLAEDDEKGGCSCSAQPKTGSWLWLGAMVGLIGLRRRSSPTF